MAVEDISTPFRSPDVYRLFSTKGFLEKIAMSGLPMKPLSPLTAVGALMRLFFFFHVKKKFGGLVAL